jgi:hypothetical protein
MKYSNKHNLPLSLAVMLATDSYEHSSEPKTISVTSLLSSVRAIVLGSRIPTTEATIDISQLLASRLGTALHDSLEAAWLNPKLPEVLASLGLPQSFIKRVRVNPEVHDEAMFNIYLEHRTKKELNGWVISGQYDMVIDGCVNDLKSTGTFAWGKDAKEHDYIAQMSIYKWLNPDKILDDTGNVLFWFKDWNKNYAYGSKPYPAQPIVEQPLQLWSEYATEDFIESKLDLLDEYWDKPEAELPQCTKAELWQGESTFKYFGKADAVKASKVFTTSHEALSHQLSKGKGYVKEFPSIPTKCMWCNAASKCSQANGYVNQGLIKLGV